MTRDEGQIFQKKIKKNLGRIWRGVWRGKEGLGKKREKKKTQEEKNVKNPGKVLKMTAKTFVSEK